VLWRPTTPASRTKSRQTAEESRTSGLCMQINLLSSALVIDNLVEGGQYFGRSRKTFIFVIHNVTFQQVYSIILTSTWPWPRNVVTPTSWLLILMDYECIDYWLGLSGMEISRNHISSYLAWSKNFWIGLTFYALFLVVKQPLERIPKFWKFCLFVCVLSVTNHRLTINKATIVNQEPVLWVVWLLFYDIKISK
jgi:hypothetical protein